jgi:hypothetical protein
MTPLGHLISTQMLDSYPGYKRMRSWDFVTDTLAINPFLMITRTGESWAPMREEESLLTNIKKARGMAQMAEH